MLLSTVSNLFKKNLGFSQNFNVQQCLKRIPTQPAIAKFSTNKNKASSQSEISRVPSPKAIKFSAETCNLVNTLRNQIKYFAVVQIKGKKYTVTENDTVILSSSEELKIGDILQLDQVCELGSKDYSIVGKPFVSPHYYNIQATVVEHVRGPEFAIIKFKKRKGYRREHHYRNYYTLLKIHKLDINKLTPSS